jgi:hypothetical protein
MRGTGISIPHKTLNMIQLINGSSTSTRMFKNLDMTSKHMFKNLSQCTNVIYKVIWKLLAKRLTIYLSEIVI